MTKIVHASISENGTINGRPGDQTRGEVCKRDLYARGWRWILRPVDYLTATDITVLAEQAADNENIGYGQADRLSLWEHVTENDIAFLDEVDEPVNCDCSSLVAVIVNLAGIKVPPDMWTGVERDQLVKTGKFTSLEYTDKTPLLVGDILLASGHTAIVVEVDKSDDTVEFADIFNGEICGTYWPDTTVNVRTGPGTDRKILRTVGRSDALRNYGYMSIDRRGVVWILIMDSKNRIGWVSCNVVSREKNGEE
jgi:hypothetical protein